MEVKELYLPLVRKYFERFVPMFSCIYVCLCRFYEKLLDTVLILLDENDAKVLFQLLILLEQTISLCVDNRLEILHYGEFDSRLDALSLNPNTAVSDQSRKVEEQLREYFGHVFPIDS